MIQKMSTKKKEYKKATYALHCIIYTVTKACE